MAPTKRSQLSPSRREEAVLLALVLLAAAVLRLGWPGLTEFKADEARLLALVYDMVEQRQLALRGIGSSVGFPNFPMSVWLYAIPVAVWRHPYAATLFTGLLNTIAVAGAYWLVRRVWGVWTALTMILLLAVSPWAVIFSRKIWAQNLLPLFVLGWGSGAVLAFVEKRPIIPIRVISTSSTTCSMRAVSEYPRLMQRLSPVATGRPVTWW